MAESAKTQPAFDTVALFLQGGGALGSYQGGAYEALEEVGLRPKIVSGISIGAFNGAIIAGNPPEQRVAKLKAFWNNITRDIPLSDEAQTQGGRIIGVFESLDTAVLQGIPGLATPRPHLNILKQVGRMFLRAVLGKNADSYFLNTDQEALLKAYIDFVGLNAKQYGVEKFAVGTADAATGKAKFFDNVTGKITPAHIMASAAIAPVMPMVTIDGKLYEDGWFAGNNPMEWAHASGVLGPNTFCVHVHLTDFHAKKEHPHKSKPIPPVTPNSHDVNDPATGNYTMNIFYHHPAYELHADSADFSRGAKEERWKAGYEDTLKGLCNCGQLDRFSPEVVARLAPHIWKTYPDALQHLSPKTLALVCNQSVVRTPQLRLAIENLSPDNARALNDHYPQIWDNIEPDLKPKLLQKLEQEQLAAKEHAGDIIARRHATHASTIAR